MDQAETKMAWLYVRQLWPRYELPLSEHEVAMREQAWLRQLGDLTLPVVQGAVDALAGERFPPSVGQIRQAANALVLQASGEAAPDPDEAWAEVKAAVRRFGSYRTPTWSHPAVEAAVGAMGWRDFCLSDVEAEGTWRAHFLRFYGSTRARSDQQVGVGPAPAVAALAERLRVPELEVHGE